MKEDIVLSEEQKKIIIEQWKDDKTPMIKDLIIAAYNNAKENLKKKSSEQLSKIASGINLPFDMKFPS